MKLLKKEYRNHSSEELARECARIAADTKAEQLVALDVRGLCSFTDFFVIMNGRSTRHVQGLAQALESAFRSKRISASRAEGLQEGNWVLLDFEDVVVHIFYHEFRKFYDLDGLWHEAKRLDIDDLFQDVD